MRSHQRVKAPGKSTGIAGAAVTAKMKGTAQRTAYWIMWERSAGSLISSRLNSRTMSTDIGSTHTQNSGQPLSPR